MSTFQSKHSPNLRGLVISLDFELMWGLFDLPDARRFMPSVLGVRRAIPAMLALFDAYEIHATWAAVGMLLHADRRSLFKALPEVRPGYADPRLSAYSRLNEIGCFGGQRPHTILD